MTDKVVPENHIAFFEVKHGEEVFPLRAFPNARIYHNPVQQTEDDVSKVEVVSVMVHSKLDREQIDRFPNLKLITTRSVGYDHIDLKYAYEKGIPVVHVPDYGSHVIAEHVFALLLASIRRVLEGEAETEAGKFEDEGLMGMSLKGRTIGIIGTGKIGAHVCRIASHGFLMNTIAYDVHPNKELAEEYHFRYMDSLDELYKHSDIITLHVPLFESTRHMINKDTIAKMKDGAVLINTSRGGLIKTEDLLDALRAGKFSHVALDVVEHEDNLKEAQELLSFPNLIITPHIAYYTRESVENMYSSVIKSMQEFFEGRELKNRIQGI